MTESWDLRSNIKAKPGSQGTLFQPASKSLLNPQQRWPRGYTPERQNEIREALKDTPVEGRYAPDAAHQRARVVDTVARSTVPAHNLRGLSRIDANVKEGTLGTYWPGTQRLAVNMLNRDQWKDDDSGQTLIHELGHHRDFQSGTASAGGITDEKIEHTAQAMNPGREVNTTMKIQADQEIRRGRAEGYADNYMVRNYRTRGRNPQPVTQGAYEQNFPAPEYRNRQYPGYNDIRPPQTPALGAQFHAGQERLLRVTPTGNLRVPVELQSPQERSRLDANRWAVGH